MNLHNIVEILNFHVVSRIFSELDRPLGTDTLEYAWLIEIQCGSLFGKVTAAQLYNVFVSLETFLFLAVDKENDLRHPRPFKLCQHHENQKECPKHTVEDCCTDICLTVEEMKYKLARYSKKQKFRETVLQHCCVYFIYLKSLSIYIGLQWTLLMSIL